MRNTFDRFNGRHQDYQAARPSYAQEFLDWLGELYAPPKKSRMRGSSSPIPPVNP